MIYYSSSIINNKNFSDEAIFCYLALRSMDTQSHFVYVSPVILWGYMLREDIPLSDHLSNKILNGLYELQDNGLITAKPSGKHHLHFIKTNNLFLDAKCNFFGTIREDEIESLLKVSAEGNNKFGLLRYYASVLSTFSSKIYLNIDGQNRNYVASNIPLDLIVNLSNLSRNTIFKYNKILKEMKMLYIANPHYLSCNYYCRYENNGALDAYLSNLSFEIANNNSEILEIRRCANA